jgi:signal transduction histidine kinase
MAKIRVRARAVDMLGRQQIAGIPTAIHELFKNAHDAYAERVEVDYFRGDGAFVLRDDGYGMSPKEFEEKWLTIGTESKIDANEPGTPLPGLFGKQTERRPVLGEKGIGRLSIATIGPQVLVLSRAIRDNGLDDLVVSFVHWGLFEIPGIDVDQIEIPVKTFPGGDLPDLKFVKGLVNLVRENVESLAGNIAPKVYNNILSQLDSFTIDPSKTDTILGSPSLKGKGHGTHFYILPTDSILEADIDEVSDTATPLQRTLLGFSNTMVPGRSRPPVLTSFRDHLRDGNIDELIGEHEFFTPEEFLEADHHFIGRFNEYGQFNGTLSLYKQPPIEYQVAWPDAHGRKTDCGPLEIKIAYVQGDRNETRLPPEVWAGIIEKLKLIGGLYIYKDGIRVLPYGNTDFDFLNIEIRRAKAHKDWFFAHRRMFGAVEINNWDNKNLVEKAGREGFRTNKAYRQLKSILENFLKQLAIDYFRHGSIYGEEYRAIKAQFVKDAETLKKRNQRLRARKKVFTDSLNGFFHALETGKPFSSADHLREQAHRDVNAIREIANPEEAARELLKVESMLRKDINKLRKEYKISKIRGVGLNKKQVSDWDAYQKNLEKLEVDVFTPLEKEINETINEVAENSAVALDRRRRIEQSLEDVSSSKKREVAILSRKAKAEVDKLSQEVIHEAQKRLASIDSTITTIYAEFAQAETAELPDEELVSLQKRFLDQITATASHESEALAIMLHQVQSLAESIKGDGTFEDETAALESTLESKLEELETYSDLAQVGSAVGIVHHELHGIITGVRKNFQKLRPWAKANDKLRGIYSDLKGSFDHLDTYLKLFTPLSRRLNREKVDINGEMIRKYLLDIFDSRILRHNVNFTATERFRAKSVKGFPSTLYPTFVNIVDNAIYWMTTEKDGTRDLILDADETGYLISNSGPGIPIRDAERIFDFGISRKTGGRGMGLYISRESLQKEGFDLVLENPGEKNHPLFRISMKERTPEGEED